MGRGRGKGQGPCDGTPPRRLAPEEDLGGGVCSLDIRRPKERSIS